MFRLRLKLQHRIYLSMLAIILLSFLTTGITAYYNYSQQNEDYHTNRLQRKEEAVTRSLNYVLSQQGGKIPADSLTTLFSDKICELSDIHSMPINFFTLRGDLIISSNPNLFEEGLIPERINYSILKQLSTGNNRAVIQEEKDGKEILLAYWYFRNEDGTPIAINSVAYFDTEVINRKELSDFLRRLAQIYILLFLGASVIGYFLASYITKSLQAIRDKLKVIDLSRKNEPLQWSSDDEIGALVKEYNRMLSEVEKSAELLAKSERESAWREMAKQVAHEIKNPLTPMKLRVQHLQRAWADGAEDFPDKLRRVSESLIEQIDALSNIATEFSNFAKMPKPNNEQFDLVQVIRNSIATFEGTEDVRINFTSPMEQAPLYADKEQVLRVFNNLIKNAIQAMVPEREGRIHILLQTEGASYVVAVNDNGEGIPEDQRERIFVPNFTTKSTGTGLGLAMVKSIAEQAGGEVWFESRPGEGSTFFVRFPMAEV